MQGKYCPFCCLTEWALLFHRKFRRISCEIKPSGQEAHAAQRKEGCLRQPRGGAKKQASFSEVRVGELRRAYPLYWAACLSIIAKVKNI